MRLEWRTRETLLATGLFAAIVALILSFTVAGHVVGALPSLAAERPDTARLQAGEVAGLLWVAFVFATTLGLGRAFAREREAGGMDALLLIPADWTYIYLAKLFATALFTLLAHTVTLGVFLVLLGLKASVGTYVLILAIAMVATFGHIALGLIVAAMTSSLRAREVLLPVLLLPMLVPLFLAATDATTVALTEFALPDAGRAFAQSMTFLTLLTLVYLAVGLVVFPQALRE